MKLLPVLLPSEVPVHEKLHLLASDSTKICMYFTEDLTRICAEYKGSCAIVGFVKVGVPHP